MKKTYTEEFKLTIVKLSESGHPTKKLSEEYGVCKTTINAWRRAYRNNSTGKVSYEPSPEEKQIKELEKQVRDLSLERDILKKVAAVALWASSPRETREI
jgi:transposase